MEEKQKLPVVPVPVDHMEIFYKSVAEPKSLPYAYCSKLTTIEILWRKGIYAAELEWEKIQGKIPFP